MTPYRDDATDWIKDSWHWRQHHTRFERYVEAHGLPCQDCGGMGGEVEPVTDEGQGPWEVCGWCEGTGLVTRHLRGKWLHWKAEEKRGWQPMDGAA